MSQTILFYPGDGSKDTYIEVAYISDYPRGEDGACAFCHGDPCAETESVDSLTIRAYLAKNSWEDTCPLCKGRPT